jgi:hypothetical protein
MEIKVVYDASKRRGGKTIVRSSPIRPGRRAGGGVVLVSLLNLAVAGMMYYATWWQVDPFLYITMIKKTPIDVPADFGSSGFFVSPPKRVQTPPVGGTANGKSPRGSEGAAGDAPDANGKPAEEGTRDQVESPSEKVRWGGKTAQVMIPAAAYGWLMLATVGACSLALAGGAGFGAVGGKRLRRAGWILAPGLAIGLAFTVYKMWSQSDVKAGQETKLLEYLVQSLGGMNYSPVQLRMWMGGLTLLSLSAGMAVGGRVRGLTRLAAVTVILAAFGSAVGVWLWSQCGALEAGQTSVMVLALVFVVHSTWGWMLWPLSRRM